MVTPEPYVAAVQFYGVKADLLDQLRGPHKVGGDALHVGRVHLKREVLLLGVGFGSTSGAHGSRGGVEGGSHGKRMGEDQN